MVLRNILHPKYYSIKGTGWQSIGGRSASSCTRCWRATLHSKMTTRWIYIVKSLTQSLDIPRALIRIYNHSLNICWGATYPRDMEIWKMGPMISRTIDSFQAWTGINYFLAEWQRRMSQIRKTLKTKKKCQIGKKTSSKEQWSCSRATIHSSIGEALLPIMYNDS